MITAIQRGDCLHLCLLLLLCAVFPCSDGKVWINEVFSSSVIPEVDWVELYNDDKYNNIDITGYYFSDSTTLLKRYQFPHGSIVPADGYYILTQNEYLFGLKLKGERALLVAPDGITIVDSVRFLGSREDVTYGRWVLPTGVDKHPFMRYISFGAPNPYPLIASVVISAINYYPPTGGYEFIEFTNLTDQSIQLWNEHSKFSTWLIEQFFFPPNTTITPYQKIYVTPSTDIDEYRAHYDIPLSDQVIGYFRPTGQLDPVGGQLADLGERLNLNYQGDPDANFRVPYIPVDVVRYDANDWGPEVNGGGYFIRKISPASYGDNFANWAPARFGEGFAALGCSNDTQCFSDECTISTCVESKCVFTIDHESKPVCGSIYDTGIAFPLAKSIGTIECVVSHWSPWSQCTRLCGGGQQYRTRSVVVEPTGPTNVCPNLYEVAFCNGPLCSDGLTTPCVLDTWKEWTPCSLSCGIGSRLRSRVVNASGHLCLEEIIESQQCTECAEPPPAIRNYSKLPIYSSSSRPFPFEFLQLSLLLLVLIG
eukprot:TRINITY_DN613_c0_g1_i3.p1 TRINITY_DN613_c0_g1~~TRINITY_DN613_c0_g1_i3.p1  ORF type:complete len:537 (+),score=36.91 TRINITY_DN613_c0_g1_i3:85-1695(+)